MTNEEIIEEILIEAHSYGIREQVLKLANSLLMLNPKMHRCTAYEEAFQQLTNGQD
jgi:hypothetical protein